jgi:hypothetical protein
MPPLLLGLWREQHPQGHEQKALNFNVRPALPMAVPLFTQSIESNSENQNQGWRKSLI